MISAHPASAINRDEPIRVGLVGCGAFAHTQHLPNCRQLPNVSVKWACDTVPSKAEAVQREYGIPHVTANPDELFDDPEVNLVIVATSHEAHLPLIRQAAEHGKHILCEKPLALTVADGLEMLRLVKASGIKCCVDHNRRCAPALLALKRKFLDFRRHPSHQPWRYVEAARAPFRDEINPTLMVRVQDESASHRVVHKDPVYGGGAIIGESTHWYDLFAWFFEEDEPLRVTALGSCTFNHIVHVEFRSGAMATLLFHTGGTFDYPKELYEIACQGALFRSEGFLENQVYGVPREGREVFPLERDPLPKVGAEGGLPGYLEKLAAVTRDSSNFKHQANTLTVDKGHRSLLAGFIDAIRGGGPVPCSEVDAFRAVYLATLAIESIRTGRTMPVEMRFWHPFVHIR